MESVWYVVEAVNESQIFDIKYPESAEEQRKIAREFQSVSAANFNICVGAIDGILIWIKKPTNKNAQQAGSGQMRFLCGRKGKFSLNCQAVSDVRGRFLDISIGYGGSSSDCLAFEASSLYERCENGLMKDGCVLFGDNAYLNYRLPIFNCHSSRGCIITVNISILDMTKVNKSMHHSLVYFVTRPFFVFLLLHICRVQLL
ncbi:hypothetical protein ACHAXH_000053 [Discostella pseudostelligera]